QSSLAFALGDDNPLRLDATLAGKPLYPLDGDGLAPVVHGREGNPQAAGFLAKSRTTCARQLWPGIGIAIHALGKNAAFDVVDVHCSMSLRKPAGALVAIYPVLRGSQRVPNVPRLYSAL